MFRWFWFQLCSSWLVGLSKHACRLGLHDSEFPIIHICNIWVSKEINSLQSFAKFEQLRDIAYYPLLEQMILCKNNIYLLQMKGYELMKRQEILQLLWIKFESVCFSCEIAKSQVSLFVFLLFQGADTRWGGEGAEILSYLDHLNKIIRALRTATKG